MDDRVRVVLPDGLGELELSEDQAYQTLVTLTTSSMYLFSRKHP